MEQEIFELLLEIRKNGNIKDLPSTRINAEQRKLDTEKERRFNVFIKHGLISNNGNSVFIITEYGYDVSEHKSWKEYLEHRSNLNNDKTNKEKYDLKISKFKSKSGWLPYAISILGVIIAGFSLYYSVFKKDQESKPCKVNISTMSKQNTLQANKDSSTNNIQNEKAVDNDTFRLESQTKK